VTIPRNFCGAGPIKIGPDNTSDSTVKKAYRRNLTGGSPRIEVALSFQNPASSLKMFPKGDKYIQFKSKF
jgi:hypothetical protein